MVIEIDYRAFGNNVVDRISCVETFVAVAQALSFSEAADRLDISPSIATKKIRWLEDYLGLRLLNRTTRKVVLTDVGQIYLEHCLRILDEFEMAERSAASLSQNLVGQLRIAGSVSFGRLHLAAAAQSFMELWPQVSIDLRLSDESFDLLDGNFDLLVRGVESIADSSLISTKLATNRRVVCASPDYIEKHGLPNHPNDLRHHRCIVNSTRRELQEWEFEKGGKKLTFFTNAKLRINTSAALETAVLDGAGIVRLPTYIVGKWLSNGSLVQLLPDYSIPENALYLFYPHRRLLSPKVKCFIEHLKEHVGRPPHWDQFSRPV